MIPKGASQNEQEQQYVLRQKFSDFFTQNSYPLLKSFNRNKKLSIILLLIKHIQFMFLQISPGIKNHLIIKDQNNEFIDHFLVLYNDDELNNTLFYIIFAFNVVLMITYLTYLGFYLCFEKINQNNLLVSFFFQIYYYILLIPSIILSFNQINNKPVLTYFNLGFTLSIIFVQGLHEYDFSFKPKDFLAQKSIFVKILTNCTEMLVLLILQSATWKQVSIINIIFFFLMILVDIFYVPLMNRETQISNTFGFLFHFFFGINLILVLQVEKWNIFNLFSILLFPLSYKISKVIHCNKKRHIQNILINRERSILYTSANKKMINQYVKSYKPFVVDYYLRSIYCSLKTDFDDYLSSKSSLILEDLITSHQIYCVSPQFCFCTQNYDEKENSIRQNYLYDYIEKFYENEIQKSKQLNILHISYLHFLIDVQKNPNKCLVKVYQLLQQSTYHSISYRQIINNLIEKAKDELTHKNQNKLLQNQQFIYSSRYVEFINFDTQINLCYKNMLECLNMKKSAIQLIGQDTVDIQSIWLQLKLTRDKRNQTFLSLYTLIRKKIPSQQMNFLIEIFEKSLCFDERLSLLSKKINQQCLRFDQQQKQQYFIDHKTCSVFVSLTNIGQVTMVSNNFDKIVPIYSNSECIGKNINFMQPAAVSQVHDKILSNYLTKVRSEKSQISLDLVIGIDKEGWAIPYNINMQTCLIESKDFGICAQIKQIESYNLYILVDQKDFRIICNSYQFYDQILSKSVTKKQISDVNLSKLIPALNLIIFQHQKIKNSQNFQKSFQTILIRPQDKSDMADLNTFKIKPGNVNQLLDYDLFSIKGVIYSIQSQFINLLQIQVDDLVHLNDQNAKIEEIKVIKEQLIQNKKFVEQIQQEENISSLDFLSNKYLNSQGSPQQENKILLEKQVQFSNSNNQNYTINYQTLQLNQLFPYSSNNNNNEYSANLSFIQEINHENSHNEFPIEDEARFSKIFSPQTSLNLINQQTGCQHVLQDERENSLLGEGKMSYPQQKKFFFANKKQQSTFEGTKLSDTFLGQQTKVSLNNLQYQQDPLSSSRKMLVNPNSSVNNPQQVSQKDSTMKDSVSQQFQQVKIKHEIQIEGSVQTSQSGRTAFRKSIIESIQAKLKIRGLTIVQLIWCFSFFLFLFLNVLNYYTLDKSLRTQKSQHKFVDWGSKVLTTLSQTIVDQMLTQALVVPYFKPKDDQKDIIQHIQSKQQQRQQIFKTLVLQYLNSDKEESDIFSFATEFEQTFTFAFNTTRIQNYQLKFGYIQEALYGYLYHQVYSLDPLGQNSLQISLNYVNTTNSVQAIQQYANSKLYENFDSTIEQELISVIIILVTSLIFSISFIPIYSFIQNQRQEILTLFTTFPPNKLMVLLGETINYINILQNNETKFNQNQNSHRKKDLCKSQGQINLEDMKNLIKKKKNISTVNGLPKFNFKVLLYSSIFFILVQIHSITSYFLVKDFFHSERVNRQFTIVKNISKLIINFHTNQYPKIMFIQVFLIGYFNKQTKIIENGSYLAKINQSNVFLKFQQKQQIDDFLNTTDFSSNVNIVRVPIVLLSLTQNKDLLALYIQRAETNLERVGFELNLLYSVVNNYYSETRYKQNEFNKYISGVLEGNACQQVADNMDLLTDEGFSLDECNKAANGIFTTGLVKSIKQVVDFFVARMPSYYIQNLKVFLPTILEQEKSFSFVDSYYYRLYLFYIVQSVQQKVSNITYDHYDLMITLNKILLSIYLLSLVFAIIIAYNKFFKQHMRKLRETKLLLDFIEVHVLEENQYILTYFKLSR